MANLTESATWSSGVYKIETTDLVLGGDGVGDISNQQAKSLANRTTYLKGQVEKANEELVKCLLGTYTTNEVVILQGCVITGTTSKSITAGSLFYNGQVYKVAAASSITTGTTWIFALKTDVNPYQVEFKAGASGTGIANWDSTSISRFNYEASHGDIFADNTVSTDECNFTVLATAQVVGNMVHISGVLQALVTDDVALNALSTPLTVVFDLNPKFYLKTASNSFIGSVAGSLRGVYSVAGYILPGDGVNVPPVADQKLRFVINFGGTATNGDNIELGFSITYRLK